MKKPATLIYTHGGGRLGNQIIRLTHWLAWVQAHPGEVNVIDLGFWPYAKYFDRWRDNPGCSFPQQSGIADFAAGISRLVPAKGWARLERRFQHFVHASGRRWPHGGGIALNDSAGESFNLDDPDFLREVTSRRVTTCSGWKIASWRLVAAQQAGLREFFRPHPARARPAVDFMAKLRATHDLIVGVLIRQSDYRVWNKGRFYFSSSQYAQWIRQLLELHPGRTPAFVVASEEAQDPGCFAALPVHMATGNPASGGHWFENWVELSACDFVLTAPSTFSATAAFVGEVPLWPVTAAGQILAFDQLLRDPLIDAYRDPIFSECVQ